LEPLPIDEFEENHTAGSNTSLNIYPIPTAGIVILLGLTPGNEAEEIYNLQGKCIEKIISGSGKTTIDLSAQENGLFLIHTNKGTAKVLVKK